MPDKSKEARIEDELKRISAFFEDLEDDKLAIVGPLLQNAAFMRVTLEDLQEIINSEGVVDEYKNGANQYGVKQSATLQSYNALVKNYVAVIKALAQFLPYKKTVDPSPWMLRQKSAEELEEELQRREEEDRRVREELALAVAYQNESREREKAGLPPLPSFAVWKREKAKEKGGEYDGEGND